MGKDGKIRLLTVDLSYVRVEIITCSGRFNVVFADGKIAKAFALFALFGVANENGLELLNNLLVSDGSTIELIQTLAVKTSTKVKIILPGDFTNQANLAEVRTATTVGATSGTNDDFVIS